MANERNNFYLPSLSPLITVADWNNMHHQRTVAAILVEVAYMLEHHRGKHGHGPQFLDLSWLEKSYHFQLIYILEDADETSAIFGALFKYIYPYPAPNSPKYVIAFRGTILKSDTRSQDINLIIKCTLNKLHHSPRFQHAMQFVQDTVNFAGAPNVWLAGHSLGSAIALLAGKKMAKMGLNLETYLFNPPFFSVPLEMINSESVKSGIRIVNSVCKAGLISMLPPQALHPFDMLSNWFPHLFVNPHDPICSGYIGYFKHREDMDEYGFGDIESLATKTSFWSLLSRGCGYSDSQADEALDLLPSAHLTINRDPKQKIKGADKIKGVHGIEQWWDPNMSSEYNRYDYNTTT